MGRGLFAACTWADGGGRVGLKKFRGKGVRGEGAVEGGGDGRGGRSVREGDGLTVMSKADYRSFKVRKIGRAHV